MADSEGDPTDHKERSQSTDSSTHHEDGWPGQTLSQAAIYDNWELLECLLEGEERVHINSTDFCERTAVYTAVSNGSLKSLNILLDHGADPDIAGGSRTGFMTPLHLAVADDKPEFVRILLQHGASLELRDGERETPLSLARSTNRCLITMIEQEMGSRNQRLKAVVQELRDECSGGDVVKVRDLLARLQLENILAQAVNDTSDNLYTPLSLVSRRGYTDIGQLLIEHGADGTPHPQTNETPLHIVCEYGFQDLTQLLLQKFPALVNATTTEDELPIHIAAQKGHVELVKMLLSFPYDTATVDFHKYRLKGRVFSAPFDVNANDARLRTPLLYACEKGHTDVVKYLLSDLRVTSEPDPTCDWSEVTMDTENQSILYSRFGQSMRGTVRGRHRNPAGAESCSESICPVDVDVTNQDGCSVLYVTMKQKIYSMVNMVLQAGANPSVAWKVEETEVSPLMLSCLNDDLRMMQLLLSYSARDDNNLVFQKAVQIKKPAIISALLKYRCKKDLEHAIDKKGMIEKYRREMDLDEADLLEGFTSADLESSTKFPITPVSIEWSNLKKLDTIEETWIKSAIINLNPNISGCSPLEMKYFSYGVTKIDISSNVIKMLPQFLFKLPSLQILDASWNDIIDIQHDDPSSQSSTVYCPCLIRLSIHHNKLPTIPDFIFTLKALSVVDASFNEISILPSTLWSAPSLREIDLSHNKLQILPKVVTPTHRGSLLTGSLPTGQTMPTSEAVDCERISNNRHVYGESRSDETFAKELLDDEWAVSEKEVNHDVYWESHVNIVKQRQLTFKGIETMNLSHNELSRVPVGLSCLAPHLTFLDMSHNLVTCLGSPSWYPCSINQLYLNNNNILSFFTDAMHNEEALIFCHKWVDETGHPRTPVDKRCRVAPSLGSQLCHHRQHTKFINLEELNLAHNQLTAIEVLLIEGAATESSASKLEASHEYHNHSLESLKLKLLFPTLNVLDLGHNNLVHLPPEIGEMTTLKSLCLESNNITDLPPTMGLLKRLWQLDLKNCPLEGALLEMYEKNRIADVIGFLDSIREEATEYNCMNLIFVGEHKIGKTSLLRQMRKEGKPSRSAVQSRPLHWVERTSKSGTRTSQRKVEDLSTVGIDINELVLERKGKDMVTFKTWDFGGQREYYATHQYFLSTRSIYLVVWKLVSGEAGMKCIREWLGNIQARAPGSAVIIVGTHLDVLQYHKTASNYPADFEHDMMEKLNRYRHVLEPDKHGLPNVLDIVNVSCKTGENIKQLVNQIHNEVFNLRHPKIKAQKLLRQKIPKKYLLLQEVVRNLAKERTKQGRDPVLDTNLYKASVMNKMTEDHCEVFRDMAELDQATRFLHENGVLCHYEDSSLRDLYFLDPQWLCDLLAKVVTIKEINRFAPDGVMKIGNLDFLFKDSTFTPEDIKKYIINLLEKFEVALPFDKENLLLPSLLPHEHDLLLCIRNNSDVKIPVRRKAQDHVSIRRRKKNSLSAFINDDTVPTMNIGLSKFYTGVAMSIGSFSSGREHSSKTLEDEMSDAAEQRSTPPKLKIIPCPAFSLYRLYFMMYFPSGFWPRLIIRLLADSSMFDIVREMYTDPDDSPSLSTILDKVPEWQCWRSGLGLLHLGQRVLCVKEFLSDHPESSCKYTQCELMCPQEGDWRPLDTNLSALLEISIPNFSLELTYSDEQSSTGEPSTSQTSKTVTIHRSIRSGARLMTKVVEHIDTLLHDWYPDLGELRMAQSMDGHYLITRVVPCLHCMNTQLERQSRRRRNESEWNVVEPTANDVVSMRSIQISSSVKPESRSDSLNEQLRRMNVKEKQPSKVSTKRFSAEMSDSRMPGAEVAYCRSDAETKVNHIYTFMVEECILAAKSGKDINCPIHGSISPVFVMNHCQVMAIFHLAPDLVFDDQDLLITQDQLQVGNFLGCGAFGFVFAGKLHQGEANEVTVAVKMLEPYNTGTAVTEEHQRLLDRQRRNWQEKPMEMSTEAYLMVRHELAILRLTQHDHILPFLGIALKPLCLVLALAPCGALDAILRAYYSSQQRPPLYAVSHAIVQISLALEYLHSQNIVYRDLKSENVLVWAFPTEKYPAAPVQVKLSDYGISRMVLPGSGTKGFGGTPPFIAPEVIQQGGKTTYTLKVDCFSFGMFLFELLSCDMPFREHPMIHNINLHVYQGGRPDITPEMSRYPSYMLDLMAKCWSQEAKDRPSSEEIRCIVSFPEFSRMMDAVSLEGEVAVRAACPIHVPGTKNDGEITAADLFGQGRDLRWGKDTSTHSHVWLSTTTSNRDSLNLVHNNLEIFTYQHNKSISSRVIKMDSVVTAMSVVNGNMWCADDRRIIHIFCPDSLEKEEEFELPLQKGWCNVVAILHVVNRGEVVIALANGHLLVYTDESPGDRTESEAGTSFQKDDIFCNGYPISCAAMLQLDDCQAEVWAGQAMGKIVVQPLDSKSKSQQLSTIEPDDPNVTCQFIITDQSDLSNPSVWSYNFPGFTVYRWNARTREREASLDCTCCISDFVGAEPNTPEKLHFVQCQVTAMTVLEDYLYLGTTSGRILIANSRTMQPVQCLQSHTDTEFYIRYLVPICLETEDEESILPDPIITPGIISVGKGFRNLFHKVIEKDVINERARNSASSLLVDETVPFRRFGRDFSPRRDHTYLLSWIARDWETF